MWVAMYVHVWLFFLISDMPCKLGYMGCYMYACLCACFLVLNALIVVLMLGYEGCMHVVRLGMDLLCMYVVGLGVAFFFFGREIHGIGA
jgi:hypothetical protein